MKIKNKNNFIVFYIKLKQVIVKMIIISNKNMENSVYFPQNIYTPNTDIYKLILVNRGTNVEYVFENLDDKHLVAYEYYTFFINFTNLPADEYEYKILDSNEKIVGTGIIRLNELEMTNTYYNKNNEYIVYDKQ